jgi:hypothetical protein
MVLSFIFDKTSNELQVPREQGFFKKYYLRELPASGLLWGLSGSSEP